jgi:hypothetical protein
MDFYIERKLENGDILLEKKTYSQLEYQREDQPNGNILLHRIICVRDRSELKQYEFKSSVIVSCMINGADFDQLNYSNILQKVYHQIDDGAAIIKKTTINIKTVEKTDSGFTFLPKLGISFQRNDSTKTLLEIMTQCLENAVKLKMKINLTTGEQLTVIV